jgi:hypothetical protein
VNVRKLGPCLHKLGLNPMGLIAEEHTTRLACGDGSSSTQVDFNSAEGSRSTSQSHLLVEGEMKPTP